MALNVQTEKRSSSETISTSSSITLVGPPAPPSQRRHSLFGLYQRFLNATSTRKEYSSQTDSDFEGKLEGAASNSVSPDLLKDLMRSQNNGASSAILSANMKPVVPAEAECTGNPNISLPWNFKHVLHVDIESYPSLATNNWHIESSTIPPLAPRRGSFKIGKSKKRVFSRLSIQPTDGNISLPWNFRHNVHCVDAESFYRYIQASDAVPSGVC
ncbi:hypothetical protein PLICRDRAFT_174893 [Plicaturopsis crispa FD-325 SS-3]|nr:hypothetical protein PLICRDRAFT_174893 [Plicaturopsis crispa FD-325 SS-3]